METIAIDLTNTPRKPLDPQHVEMIRGAGTEVCFAAGETVMEIGEPVETFYLVETGEVEAVDPLTGGRYMSWTLGPGQFLGEIGFLSGLGAAIGMRAVQDSRLTAVPREDMLALMSAEPELSDHIVTVLAGRRRRMLETNTAGLTLIGAEDDRDIAHVAAFAGRNRIPVRILAPGSATAKEAAEKAGIAFDRPAAIFGDIAVSPCTPRKVAAAMGLEEPIDRDRTWDVVIVGGGPAGVAAGVYAGAEGLCALVIEDMAVGGQAGQSSRIENYMGFPTGISGADLCWRGEVQAMKFGTRFALPRRAESLARDGDSFCLTLDDGERVLARSVVAATGVQYRRLPIPRLADFEGRGIYYAATEVEARFCKSCEVVVVGGGNSAGQAAMFLSRHARHVHVLVRGDSLAASMSDYLVTRLAQNDAITIHYRSEIAGFEGEGRLGRVRIRDGGRGEEWETECRAVFVMVGAAPNTGWLSGLVELDGHGFVRTGAGVGAAGLYATSCPGIYAVGDVRAGSAKRVASAVGEGSVVISRVWDHLNG